MLSTMNESDWQYHARGFIEAHWTDATRLDQAGSFHLASSRWFEGLAETAWSVPHWPEALGGLNWPAQRLYQWQMLCHQARTPPINTLAMSAIAPLLMSHASPLQRSSLLAEIASFQVHWCLGLVEPVNAATQEATRLKKQDNSFVLSGEKRALADGLLMSTEGVQNNLWPGRMLCIALDDQQQWRACLLPLNRLGVQLTPVPNARGRWFHVILDQVKVEGREILELSGEPLLLALAQPESLSQCLLPEASSHGMAVQLRLLRQELTAHVHDDTDALLAQLYEAEVALEGLQAMESRALAAASPLLSTGMPMSALSLKSRELSQQIGALQLASFGYYALPDIDVLREHNEGLIHPRGGASGETAMITSQALSALAASDYGWNPKDILARYWLGLEDSADTVRPGET